jgi:DNA-binding NarL/FixJ family response regulator
MVDVGGADVDTVRVLVVDDEEIFRQAMAHVVAATEGFIVVGSAATGEESLAMAEASLPDLVLMDVNLPGIDGPEATQRLRSVEPRPIVLLLSTYDEVEVDYLSSGAAGYISKAAFGPDRLTDAWTTASRDPGSDREKS